MRMTVSAPGTGDALMLCSGRAPKSRVTVSDTLLVPGPDPRPQPAAPAVSAADATMAATLPGTRSAPDDDRRLVTDVAALAHGHDVPAATTDGDSARLPVR